MAGIGDINLSSNFELSSQRPLDARYTKVNVAGRDAIPLVQRYDGLPVYVEDTHVTYLLRLGTVDTNLANNANWVDTTIIVGVTNISNFVNDVNYTSIGDNISNFINDSNFVASGANISVFTNDSNFVSSGANISVFTNDSNYVVSGANISVFNNDAGYISGTFQATEIALGMAELATQTETNTGTDDLRIVTPLKLRTTTFVTGQIPSLDTSKITTGTFVAARIPQATTTALGGAELATSPETVTGTDTIRTTTPAGVKAALDDRLGTGLLQETIDIGDWNMDLDPQIFVDISSYTTYDKIKSISVLIRNNGNTQSSQLNGTDSAGLAGGFAAAVSGNNIALERVTSGRFDSTVFNSTAYNRGFITFSYIP